jgi:cell division protein FtsI/penicillin-binding protein 2
MKIININEKKDIERYLQYPLKEGIVVATNLPQDEVKQLEMNAKAEYAVAMQQQVKREKKEKKGLSDWEEFVNHLDQKEPTSIRQAYRIAIEYVKAKYDKPLTGKVIADNTERYCIKRGILTTEQLVEKYMAFY